MSCKCNKKPDIGRGAVFCDCNTECEAHSCEGCYKLHETDFLEEYPVNIPTDIVEVRFKNTRRSFYQNVNNLPLKRGDIVAVEASPGHDIGTISLTGDMVAKQMRRTGFNPFNGEYKKVFRKAKPFDIERWQEAIALEHETMIRSRQIAADMGLNMKIGDVEYQGDKIKAIFYYIADERVDFRELIKVFADQFRIRVEMKQIGARQEAGRIGGIGACGRELCCASWISSFSSVSTNAARMQELSLNPLKLAGQCSKLKCCLAYEYDTYADARKSFPRLREPLQTVDGEFYAVKNDILGGTITFSSSRDMMANVTTLSVERVREIIAQNRAGKKVDRLTVEETTDKRAEEPTYRSEEDSITRFDKQRQDRRSRNNRNGNRPKNGAKPNGDNKSEREPRKDGQGNPPQQQGAPLREPRPKAEGRESDKPNGNAAAGSGNRRNNNRNRGRRNADAEPRNGQPRNNAERQANPNRNAEKRNDTPVQNKPKTEA